MHETLTSTSTPSHYPNMSEIKPFLNQQAQVLSTPLSLGSKAKRAIMDILDQDGNLTAPKKRRVLMEVDKMVDHVNAAVKAHNMQTLNKQGIHYVSIQCDKVVAEYKKSLNEEDVLDGLPLDPYVCLVGETHAKSGQSKKDDVMDEIERKGQRDILNEIQSLPVNKLFDIVPLLPSERDASSVTGLSRDVSLRYSDALKRLKRSCATYDVTLHRAQALKDLSCAVQFLENPHESVRPNLPVRRSELLDEMSKLRSLVSHIVARVERDSTGEAAAELKKLMSHEDPVTVQERLKVLLDAT